MPSVNLKSIESFSSEDPNYPASNLLKPGNKKWKCRTAGEQQAFVVIRLEEPTQITGIDIGNEHSALIEVLVARSGPSNPSFSEILLATKFMNPVESRNSTGTNGVQCFNSSVLIPSVASEKWDLVKIICTQPFNFRVKYGLTFVALHTTGAEKKERKSLVPEKFQQQIREEANKPKPPPSIGLDFGRFKLREESPDSDDAGSSNVFARWKNKNTTISTGAPGSTVSALMRDTNTPKAVEKNLPQPGSVRTVAKQRPKPQAFQDSDEEKVSKPTKTNRNDESVLYDAEDDKPAKKLNESVIGLQVRNDTGVARRESNTPKSDTKNASKIGSTSSSKFQDFLNLTGPERESKWNSHSTAEVKKSQHNSPSQLDRKKTPTKTEDQARPPLSIEKQPVPSSKRLSSPTRGSPVSKHDAASPTTKKPKLTIVDDDSDVEVKKSVQYKPFGKLLENVVLVISGIVNPDRANIRSQALAMGAKYKPDWDGSCTHLICAYKNTPKYNQVHGKGKIVKKEWIERCYTNRKRLSWRKFALDTAEADVSDSEDEIVDIANKPADAVVPQPLPREERQSPPKLVKQAQKDAVMLHELSDTDDDEPRETTVHQIYEKSTEEEGDRQEENASGGSLDFFKGKKFFLHQELGAIDIIKLEKYIELYKGSVSNDMAGVDYVIARNKNSLPPSNSRAELVKPLWIYECNDMECLIPVNRYRVV
ncbi:DNA repair protein XRCC1 [Anopheles maculipalpis]|uniref:DNA repair protein XRCC1 n=1 Tax=Anopheles maculipalpis TaxID=1496333 RepID=UPI002159A847|nr:DNA repair protein XRCC1 [Anopheles maculipalpis]